MTNPTDGKLMVSGEVSQIRVYDVSGKLVIKLHDTNEVNLQDKNAGIYTIEITSLNGLKTRKKVVKK